MSHLPKTSPLMNGRHRHLANSRLRWRQPDRDGASDQAAIQLKQPEMQLIRLPGQLLIRQRKAQGLAKNLIAEAAFGPEFLRSKNDFLEDHDVAAER